jgi:Spy/CpxP family protein refolding chaperone
VDKSRSSRFPWLFGAVALALTIPAGAGLGAWRAARADPGSVVPQRQATPPATAGSGQRGAGQPDSRRSEWEWWNDAAVKKELGLSESKAREIDRIFQERARYAKPFVDDAVKARAEQERMAAERLVDEGTFAAQVARTDALFSELRKSRAVMLYRMYRKLSAEQVKKLGEIRDRRERDGRGRGAGSR